MEEGSEQTYVLHQEQEHDHRGRRATTQTVGGRRPSRRSPTRSTPSATGVIVAKTTYGAGRVLDDPPVDAATRDVLEQLFAAFEGGEGQATFDDRGAILELQAPELGDVPAGARRLRSTRCSRASKAQASQLATPFPEEAVGVGARWRVSAAFELTGLPFEISTEVTLTALDGAIGRGAGRRSG